MQLGKSSVFLFGIMMTACTGGSGETEDTTPDVLVVYSFSFPVGHLVDRLVGDAVQHECILPAGEDAATWKPTIEQVIEMQQADLLFSNGFGFENWVKTAALPSSKLIESTRSVDPIEVTGKTHSHGKGGAHSHGETDPHAWSDPMAYLAMANVVAESLSKEQPDLDAVIQQNLGALKSELEQLDQQNDVVFATLSEVSFATNHPSFSYLMQSQELSIQNFDFDSNGAIHADDILKVQTWISAHPHPVLLWVEEPSAENKSILSGMEQAFIDPLEAPVDGSYDYVAQFKANQERFQVIATKHTSTIAQEQDAEQSTSSAPK